MSDENERRAERVKSDKANRDLLTAVDNPLRKFCTELFQLISSEGTHFFFVGKSNRKKERKKEIRFNRSGSTRQKRDKHTPLGLTFETVLERGFFLFLDHHGVRFNISSSFYQVGSVVFSFRNLTERKKERQGRKWCE
jgi:hypothetical protein